MASNRGVVFLGPNHVEVQSIDYPKFENPLDRLASPQPPPPTSWAPPSS